MARRPVVLAGVRGLIRSGEARQRRISAALSLSEVAADVGVSTAAVHGWENGHYLPRGEHALRYARLLDELGQVAS